MTITNERLAEMIEECQSVIGTVDHMGKSEYDRVSDTASALTELQTIRAALPRYKGGEVALLGDTIEYDTVSYVVVGMSQGGRILVRFHDTSMSFNAKSCTLISRAGEDETQ